MDMFGGSQVELPGQYQFDYMIKFKMTTDGDESNITYFLNKYEAHMGFKMADEKINSTVIMDTGRKVMVFYTVKDGKKIG